MAGCGDYSQPDDNHRGLGDVPPLWVPRPNVPIYITSRTDQQIADLRRELDSMRAQVKANKGKDKEPSLKKPSDVK